MSDDLVRLYRDDDRGLATLIGGPSDGKILDIPAEPPGLLLTALDPGPISVLDCLGPQLSSVRQAEYEPVRDELGFVSRADNGNYLYQYRSPRRA